MSEWSATLRWLAEMGSSVSSVPESVSGKGGFSDVPKVKEEAAPVYEGLTIEQLNRAVRDAEINAGIDREASSDTETQAELDAAQSQGWR